jgi:hypothetical protein
LDGLLPAKIESTRSKKPGATIPESSLRAHGDSEGVDRGKAALVHHVASFKVSGTILFVKLPRDVIVVSSGLASKRKAAIPSKA